METIKVDLSALSALAQNLQTIQTSLSSATTEFGAYEDAIGSDRVSQQLHSFAAGWSDGRETIVSEIQALVTLLQNSVDDYIANQNAMVAAMQSGGATTTAK